MISKNDPPGASRATQVRKETLTHSPGQQLRLNFKQTLVLASVPLTATAGNTLLAVGMRQIGRIGMHNWRLLFAALLNPYVVVGILLLLGFFGSYLAALSWADLTYVIPATSFGYILVPLVSHVFLKESVTIYRWMGVMLICCGVIVGAQGPVRTGPRLAGEES